MEAARLNAPRALFPPGRSSCCCHRGRLPTAQLHPLAALPGKWRRQLLRGPARRGTLRHTQWSVSPDCTQASSSSSHDACQAGKLADPGFASLRCPIRRTWQEASGWSSCSEVERMTTSPVVTTKDLH